MTLEEISTLLAVIAAMDRRKVGKTDVLTWHATVGDLDFQEARSAVWQHFAQSTDWLMPAHVRRIVKANQPIHTMSPSRQLEQGQGGPMPEHVKALLEDVWGPRERWDSRDKLRARPLVHKPDEPDMPVSKMPQRLGELMRALPKKPCETPQEAEIDQGVPRVPARV